MANLNNRSYDTLGQREITPEYGTVPCLSDNARISLAGHQKELCMVGDSITWAEEGDWFRWHLLAFLPELAFVGTHTGMLGYSHAGEGGDSTLDVLERVNDPERIPDAEYYHLLIGINDCSCAKTFDDVESVAAATAPRIVQAVKALLARGKTRKVFLGSILPGPFEPSTGDRTPRDAAGSRTNELLRQCFDREFPDGRTVWIEYESPLRSMLEQWEKVLHGAHPSASGYRRLAELASPILLREMECCNIPSDGESTGVKVTNLWMEHARESRPLLPGWYILSFRLEGAGSADFTLYSTGDPEKGRFEKQYHIESVSGQRIELEFMTGYESYGYIRAPFRIKMEKGSAVEIQIEKMRPLRHASSYGMGDFTDLQSPIAAGEKMILG